MYDIYVVKDVKMDSTRSAKVNELYKYISTCTRRNESLYSSKKTEGKKIRESSLRSKRIREKKVQKGQYFTAKKNKKKKTAIELYIWIILI